MRGSDRLGAFLATALCAGLVGRGCSSSGPAGGFAAVGDDASGPGPGSSGGDDGAGPVGSEGGANNGPVATTVGESGAGTSSGTGPTGTDAARDAPAGDARGPEAGSTSTSDGGASLDAVRQACVDRINMYRATIGVAALSRAPASTEACSDMGAMHDATSNSPHSSAGMCSGTGAQDTCPSLPAGGSPGAALLASLKQCIDQMWAEGPPPSGTTVQQCIQDYTGCFLKHGHYINMSDSYMHQTGVSCGFYLMSNGAYWGNQDFMP